MNIKESNVLVTGGASGLGKNISQQLSYLGANVVVFDNNEAALAELECAAAKFVVNVTDQARVNAAVKEINESIGHVDILINNAGNIFNAPFVNVLNSSDLMHSYQDFAECIKLNLDSVFIVSAAVVEHMVRSRSKGCLINVSSVCAAGNAGQTAYSAAKAGVNAVTKTWAKELGVFGIRCNAIAPGYVNTNSTKTALSVEKLSQIQNGISLKRLGEANEITHGIIALIENDYITGEVLNVNGGLVI